MGNGWYASCYGDKTDFHRVDNLCRKNMIVYRAPHTGRPCSTAAGAAAQLLLNTASNGWDTSLEVVQAIMNGQSGYGLDPYLILSWDGATEWSSWSQSSCHVDNNKALYYIRYFAYDPTTTTTTTSTTSTKSTTTSTTSTTKKTTTGIQPGGGGSSGSFSAADTVAIDMLQIVVVLMAYVSAFLMDV